MADFHFGSLLSSVAEVEVFFATSDFAFDPWSECFGRVEMFLKRAQDVCGRDAFGFMDGCDRFRNKSA